MVILLLHNNRVIKFKLYSSFHPVEVSKDLIIILFVPITIHTCYMILSVYRYQSRNLKHAQCYALLHIFMCMVLM